MAPVNKGNDLLKLNGNGITSGPVDGSGTRQFTFTAGAPGQQYDVEVDYSDSTGSFGASAGHFALTVNNPLQNTQTVVTCNPPSPNPGDTVTVTATTTVTP